MIDGHCVGTRKCGLEVTLANQALSSVSGRNGRDDLAHGLLANCGSIVALRAGPTDAVLLAAWLGGGVDARELTDLPNRGAAARLASPTGPARVTRFRTLAPD